MTNPRVAILLMLAALTGCAAQQSAEPDATPGTEPSASDRSAEQASSRNEGAGARPIVRPSERTTPRLDPAMESQGSTALARSSDAPNAAIPPSTPGEWNPAWFTGSVVTTGETRFGSSVATHRDLLEARRQAVSAAFDLVDGVIDQTVTRQLDDGRFRVWVRISDAEG